MGGSIESQLDPETLNALVKLARDIAPASNPGEVYERRFEFVLDELQGQKVISSWQSTEKNSHDDKEGIDYWVKHNGHSIPFSITGTRSSDHAKVRSRENRKRKKGGILNVFIREQSGELKDVKEIRKKVIESIERYYNRK